MRPHQAYLLGATLGLATLALGVALQVLPVAASPHAGAPAPAFDRTLKGDRLGDRLPGAVPAEAQGQKTQQPRLPEGCEASVSSISHSSLAQTPARCLS